MSRQLDAWRLISLVGNAPLNKRQAIPIMKMIPEEQHPDHAFDLIIADECHRGYTSKETALWRDVLEYFDSVKIGLTATPAPHAEKPLGRRFAADLGLKFDERVQISLRPRRAAAHVNIHRHDPIHPLRPGVAAIHATRAGARPHRDDPFGRRHLVVDAADLRGHLVGHGAGHDHAIRLPGQKPHHFGAEAGDVEAARRRRSISFFHFVCRPAGRPTSTPRESLRNSTAAGISRHLPRFCHRGHVCRRSRARFWGRALLS